MGLIEQRVAAELAQWPGFKAAGLDAEKISAGLARPPREDMGDLAFATFQFAKQAGKPPAQLALELVAGRDTASISKRWKAVPEAKAPAGKPGGTAHPAPSSGQYQRPSILVIGVSTAGPYVNIRLNRSAVTEAVLAEIEQRGEDYGDSAIGEGKTLVLDFSHPNIAKPLAVHHLRSTMIGNSIKMLRESQGWRVVGINHLGDWGTGFGKLIAGLKRYFPETAERAKQGDERPLGDMSVQQLNDAYVRFNTDSKENEELAEQGRHEFAMLERYIEALLTGVQHEAGDEGPANFRLWQHAREISLTEFERMYAHLGVSFHTWPVVDHDRKRVLTEQPDEFYRLHGVYVGESYYVSAEDLCRRIIVDAVENKVAEESEGALVIYTHGKDRPPLMLVKKDGATSYHARDMAAALYRKRHWPFDEMTYVVGGEQKLHFEQLFKALELLGHEWAKNCHHVDFGVLLFKQIDGKWAKTSTRRGTSILLEEVLDEAIASVREIMQAKNPELASSPDGEAIAQAIGVGAVVFNDLKNGRRNNIKFDWDAVLDFEGESGPYMLYQYVRMGSVMQKFADEYTSGRDATPGPSDAPGSGADGAARATGKHSQTGWSLEQVADAATHGDAALLKSDEEWRILRLLADFPDAIAKASHEYEPSVVARHLIDLAGATSSWWAATRDTRIVGEDRELSLARVRLVNAIRTTLGKGLKLLGMTPVERM